MPRKAYETLDRLLDMAFFIIRSPGGVTFDNIRAEYSGVSRRTLYRDLNRLSIVLNIIKERGIDGLDYWKFNGNMINPPDLFFSQDEMVALKIAQGFISSYFEGTEIKKWLDSLFEKIDRTLHPMRRNILEQIGECYSVIQYGIKDYSGVTRFFPTIIDAIAWLKRLKISYLPAGEDKPQDYTFDPYGLVNAKGGFYLVGYIHEHKGIRTLAVERIQSVNQISEKKHAYDIPPDFSLKKYFKYAFGLIPSTPEEVVIRFDKTLERYLSERKWPGFKKLKRMNKHVELHLHIGVTRELISWILSFGEHAEVIKPKSLRARIKKDLKSTLKKYQ